MLLNPLSPLKGDTIMVLFFELSFTKEGDKVKLMLT
jgi:hypothetical protein